MVLMLLMVRIDDDIDTIIMGIFCHTLSIQKKGHPEWSLPRSLIEQKFDDNDDDDDDKRCLMLAGA